MNKRSRSDAFQNDEEDSSMISPRAYKPISPFRRTSSTPNPTTPNQKNSASSNVTPITSNQKQSNSFASSNSPVQNLRNEQDLIDRGKRLFEDNNNQTTNHQTESDLILKSIFHESENIPLTLIIIRNLKGLFYHHSQEKNKPLALPIILRSQIYATHPDRTLIDKELNRLNLETKEIRVFKFTTRDEYLVMLTEDFLVHVKQTAEDLKAQNIYKSIDLAVIDKFLRNVSLTQYDITITKKKLESLMEITQVKELEDCVTMMISVGVLNMSKDPNIYYLSIPGVGAFFSEAFEGRKAILTHLSQTQFRESLEKDMLTNKKLSDRQFPFEMYVKDLVGLGKVQRVKTNAGYLLRLPPDST